LSKIGCLGLLARFLDEGKIPWTHGLKPWRAIPFRSFVQRQYNKEDPLSQEKNVELQ